MGNREEFEKWAKQEGFDVAKWTDEPVDYQSLATGCANKGYQARQPEIDALKAEVERLRGLLHDLPPLCEIERLQRNEAELRKDAGRFAFFSDPARIVDFSDQYINQLSGTKLSIDAWREAIDAAMKETK